MRIGTKRSKCYRIASVNPRSCHWKRFYHQKRSDVVVVFFCRNVMDYLDLRTKTDCLIFDQINSIYQLNDMCRVLIDEKTVVKGVCDKIYKKLKHNDKLSILPPTSFLEFQKHCAYLILKSTLNDIFAEEDKNKTDAPSIDQLRKINREELKSYWLRIDYMTTTEAKNLIKEFILKQCELISKKCYSNTRSDSTDKSCWLCDVDSCYLGIGRLDDPCHNGQSLKHKSTSFVDRFEFGDNCSHVLSKSKSKLDKFINKHRK